MPWCRYSVRAPRRTTNTSTAMTMVVSRTKGATEAVTDLIWSIGPKEEKNVDHWISHRFLSSSD
jgi:hypothetical protein